MKHNPFAFCAVAALCIGLLSGCGGGGGNNEKVPDLASQGDKADEPQTPIRNAALRAGIRPMPPIPAERVQDVPGLNAYLQLLVHNPTWVEKFYSTEIFNQYHDLKEFVVLQAFVNAFRAAQSLEKPHAALLDIDFAAQDAEGELAGFIARLGLAPVKGDTINDGLTKGETLFPIEHEGGVTFDQLPAQERIIGVAVYDGDENIAYLRKGDDWFGTDDQRFSKVNMDFIKRLGRDGKSKIFAVSYSAA